MNEEQTAPPPQGNGPGSTGSPGAIAPEIANTVGSILDAVEREANRLRDEAQAEAERYLERSRLRADELVEERRRRIGELSDELIAKSEAVVRRLDDVGPVREGFDNLIRALAGAAERLARERDRGASEFRPPPYHGSSSAAPATRPSAHPPAPDSAYPPAPPIPAPLSYPTQVSYPPRDDRPVPEPAQPAAAQPAASPDAVGESRRDPRAVAAEMASVGATRRATREHLQQAFGKSFYSEVLDEAFGVGTDDDAVAQPRSRRP